MPTPTEAIERLKAGNQRYIEGKHSVAGWSAARRRECLEPDRLPFAAVLACADSRVPVEVIFDQGIGDLFVVRSAGGRADNLGLASLDFAAELFKVSLIVILGHTRCGVVKFALDSPPLPGRIPQLVDRVRPSALKLRNLVGVASPDELWHKAVMHNTRDAVEEVKHQCQLVRKRMNAGTLLVVAAVYDTESGVVTWL